jgi:hypothetical protein
VGCQKEGVEPNQRILGLVTKVKGTTAMAQGSLEEWAAGKAAPQWSKEGLMEHIVELVMVDDQVRQVMFFYVP